MRHLFTTFIIFCSCFTVLAQDLNPADWAHLKGYWKFQNIKDLTKPTVGNKLMLVGTHQPVAGPAFGDTAIRIGIGSYYKYAHGIAPNGGGDSVNQYTLMFDFKVLNFKRWHTFFQTDTTNANDGECFIRPLGTRPARIGTATTGYTNDSLNANQWYRLAISVNLNHFYRYYINGKLWLEGDTQEVDGRFALLPQILFFADNDKEDDTIDVASVAIFDTCLSSKDIAKIGTIDPCIANPPKVNLGRDTALCANFNVSLNAGTGFVNYQWSTGNKLPFELVDANSIGTGKKIVWVKVTDRNGCRGGDSILINYLPLAKVDIGKDTAICQGKNVKLTAGTDLSNTYQWRLMPKGTTLSSSNTITVDSSGKYMVLVTNTFKCENTDTITLLVNKNPIKPKINVVGKLSLCKGDSVKLEGPGSYKEYNWTNGLKVQHIYIKKTETLNLKVKDGNGCESILSDSIKVVVNNLPPQPVIQLSGNSTFCEGDSLILSVTGGYKQYVWQDGIGTSTREVKKGTNYFLYVRDSNDCKSSVSNSVFVEVLSGPDRPEITVNGATTFCEGGKIKLASPANFTGYLWTDSIKTKENTITKSGIYKLKVMGNNGCYSAWSDAVMVLVNPIPPKPKVVAGSSDSLKCNTPAGRYKWFRNALELLDTSLSIYSKNSGFFQVQIAEKGCWSRLSDSLYFKNLSIRKPLELQSKILIVPNPASTKAFIRLENMHGMGYLTLYNSEGKLLMHEEINSKEGVLLNLESFKKGIYHIKVVSDGNSYSERLNKL
jgi:hypothetical protein